MILVGAGALACFVMSRERSIASGWIPSTVMFASMTSLALASTDDEIPASLTIALSPVLIAAAMLASRGKGKPMAIHRAFSCIAMAAFAVVLASNPQTPEFGNLTAVGPMNHHSMMLGSTSWMTVALSTAVLVTGSAVLFRRVQSRKSSQPKVQARIVAQAGETVLMTLGVAIMLVH